MLLVKQAMVPNQDELKKVDLMGQHAQSLLETCVHNLNCEPGQARLERVTYEQISPETVSEIKQLMAEQSQELLLKVDKLLTETHQQNQPDQPACKVGIGVYYFEQ
mgnify:CR=1 FL=1